MNIQTVSAHLNAISADQTLSRRLRDGDREALKQLNLTFEQIYTQAEEDDEVQLNPLLCGISCGPQSCLLVSETAPNDQ